MIDHLLTFIDETTAQVDPAVGKYWIPISVDGPGQWREDICIPGVEIYILASDGTTRTDIPGWHIIIALPALDPTLQISACILIADRDATVEQGKDIILYASSAALPLLTVAHVSPIPAGSTYSFGSN